jgi:hypothetical protein
MLFLVGILTVVIGLAMAFLPGVGLLSLSCEESAGSMSTTVTVYEEGKKTENETTR